MRQSPSGGNIVNVTSHAGVRPKASSVPYAASKAALNHVSGCSRPCSGPRCGSTRGLRGWWTRR
ncbi:SDR family NAD(P)-dependent oxidoreductase [Streptomyces scabichelini]|uniref:SDR family NAD(P)-dependent oxidoreductase n=1 Tax=Streptomyces scabichelini TaxID=2711217 RepID=UPI003B97C140